MAPNDDTHVNQSGPWFLASSREHLTRMPMMEPGAVYRMWNDLELPPFPDLPETTATGDGIELFSTSHTDIAASRGSRHLITDEAAEGTGPRRRYMGWDIAMTGAGGSGGRSSRSPLGEVKVIRFA